jgi:oligoribonuclease (3'-5' exoribonuclease)
MNYLSIDIEATGLRENDLIIEFGMVAVSSENGAIEKDLSFHRYIKCPSFQDLKPGLDKWVIDHNEDLINKSHYEGVTLESFKQQLAEYLSQEKVKIFFNFPNEKITILGKSLNAIDLPFLNRDLGWNFMRNYFNHQVLDVSSIVMAKIDQKILPKECRSGAKLSKYLNLGEVEHTALADAIQTAEIYLRLIQLS